MSGLTDSQAVGLNHALMQEGASTANPSQEEWGAFIDRTVANFVDGRLTIAAGSRSPINRLEDARSETPDGRRFYAAQRIVERASRLQEAQRNYLQSYARDLGMTVEGAAAEYWAAFQSASDNARLQPSPLFRRSWASNPDNVDLPADRRSVYAFEQLEIARAARQEQSAQRPAVVRRPVNSNAIVEMGYDPQSGRAEVVMRSNPSIAYAYRMTQQEWDEFSNSDSVGSYFARNIRGNSRYAYATSEDGQRASVVRNCATCGQFAGDAHSCPPLGSEEALNRDTRIAVERARARAAGSEVQEEPTPIRRVPLLRTVFYNLGEAGHLRMPGISRITQEARQNTRVMVPVRVRTSDPERPATLHMLAGNVEVLYNGRGNGYTVSAVTEPGDSRQDHLRCSCDRYRATYHCEHVDAVVAGIRAMANGEGLPTPDQVRAAAAPVTATLAAQHDASVAATQASASRWTPVNTSFADNPESFQELYEEFRAARQSYKDAIAAGADPSTLEYPVPYQTENALGGLAQRGSGRGFGTEIEFEFPSDMSAQEASRARQAIGRELHAAGLTTSARQQGYGASHGAYRDYHEGGWSYESDPTVRGGEIVSPVMFDEPETWANLKTVCDILSRHGAVPSTRAGMHVHVGVGDYDHRLENHNRLLQAFGENEDLVYRMSSNPERGSHRGSGYCRPNSLPSSPYTDLGPVRNQQSGHHIALNMQSAASGRNRDHVEFRTFDSSLAPGVMQAQIAMAVFMTEAATRPEGSTVPDESRTPRGSRVAANPDRRALTGEAWNESTLGLRRFLDRFVPGSDGDERQNPRVRQLVALFAVTRWQRNGSYTPSSAGQS